MRNVPTYHEKTTNLYSILSEISSLNNEFSKIEELIIKFDKDANKGSNIIQKASNEANYKIKGHPIPISKFSHKDIIDLMGDVEVCHSEKISIISELISVSNINVQILSHLITQLALLSGMTYSSIENLAISLDNVDGIVDENVKNTNKISGQLKDFVRKQLYRIIDEKNRYEYFLDEQKNLSQKIEDLEKERPNIIIFKGEIEKFIDNLKTEFAQNVSNANRNINLLKENITESLIKIHEQQLKEYNELFAKHKMQCNNLLIEKTNQFNEIQVACTKINDNIETAESNFLEKFSNMESEFRRDLVRFANEKIEEQNTQIYICQGEINNLKRKNFFDSYIYKIIIGITSISAFVLSLL